MVYNVKREVLQPCPFCKKGILRVKTVPGMLGEYPTPNVTFITCACGARGPEVRSLYVRDQDVSQQVKLEAISKWNRRP